MFNCMWWFAIFQIHVVSQFKILVSLLGKKRGYVCFSCVNLIVFNNELVPFNQIQQGLWVIKVTSLMNLNSILQDSPFDDQQVIIHPGIIYLYTITCALEMQKSMRHCAYLWLYSHYHGQNLGSNGHRNVDSSVGSGEQEGLQFP